MSQNKLEVRKMKAKIFGGIVALLFIAMVAAGAFAFGGAGGMPFGGFGGMRLEESDALKEAVENGDYEGYMAALEESWQAYKAEVTEDKFNEIVQRHNEMSQKMAEMQEAREKVQQDLENKDYNAWKEAIGNSPCEAKLAEVITKENFDTFVEMHNAMQSGDFDKAKQLAEELGIEGQGLGGPAKGDGFGRGFMRPNGDRMGFQIPTE